LGILCDTATGYSRKVLDKKVSVFSEPGGGGTEVFIIHEGTRVRLKREVNNWYEITLADGKTGWCENQSLGII